MTTAAPDSIRAEKFIPAKNFTVPTTPRAIRHVVMHSTETGPGSAEGIANGWASPRSPDASATYIVQCYPSRPCVIQCVQEANIAWAAPGANQSGVHIEHVGRAAPWDGTVMVSGKRVKVSDPQPRTKWEGSGGFWHGRETLQVSAGLCADICARNTIPIVRLSPQDLVDDAAGLITHWAVAEACRIAKGKNLKRPPFYREDKAKLGLNPWVGSDHADPGLANDKNWPWDLYLELVRAVPA